MSVPMASFDGPTPSLSLTALLDRTRLQPLRATNTREWQDPTILDAEFGADTYGLAELLSMARFFSSKRSEAELSTFMGSLEKRFPPTCGWIWPLMDRFKALQGLRTVLVLMQCPLRERRFGMDLGQDACFTEYFAAGLESSLKLCGASVLCVDFRKECRRNDQDNHCPGIYAPEERRLLALATVVEALIAQNVYNITIVASLSFCRGLLAASPLLNFIDSWDRGMLGSIYNIPWHPSAMASLPIIGKGFQSKAELMLLEDIVPVIRDIWPLYQGFNGRVPSSSALLQGLCDWYTACNNGTLRRLFNERAVSAPEDLTAAIGSLKALSTLTSSSATVFEKILGLANKTDQAKHIDTTENEPTGQSADVTRNEDAFWPSEVCIEPLVARVDSLLCSLADDSSLLGAIEATIPDVKAYFRQKLTTQQQLEFIINEAAKTLKANKMRYKHSEKGKAKRVAYEALEESRLKDRIRNKRYRESEKGRATKAAYRAKPEVKARRSIAIKKSQAKCYEKRQAYWLSDEVKARKRAAYHAKKASKAGEGAGIFIA